MAIVTLAYSDTLDQSQWCHYRSEHLYSQPGPHSLARPCTPSYPQGSLPLAEDGGVLRCIVVEVVVCPPAQPDPPLHHAIGVGEVAQRKDSKAALRHILLYRVNIQVGNKVGLT